MHFSSVPRILQSTIYEISNNRENFNENPSMRAIVKILRAQISEHLSKFASKSSKGQILRALENFKGPFDSPNGGLTVRIMTLVSLSMTFTATANGKKSF